MASDAAEAVSTSKLRAEWFWTDRWTGSSAFLLPLEPRGLYREMLTQAWKRGARLPNNHEAIRRATGTTEKEWARNWPKIAKYWRVDGDSLVNDVQVGVYQEALAAAEIASNRGIKGAQARHRKRLEQVLKQVPEQVPKQQPEQVPEQVLKDMPEHNPSNAQAVPEQVLESYPLSLRTEVQLVPSSVLDGTVKEDLPPLTRRPVENLSIPPESEESSRVEPPSPGTVAGGVPAAAVRDRAGAPRSGPDDRRRGVEGPDQGPAPGAGVSAGAEHRGDRVGDGLRAGGPGEAVGASPGRPESSSRAGVDVAVPRAPDAGGSRRAADADSPGRRAFDATRDRVLNLPPLQGKSRLRAPVRAVAGAARSSDKPDEGAD